jgi:hypothetical protein
MSGQVVELPVHAHAWRMMMHLDGCHWYATHLACECGAQREQWAERDFRRGHGLGAMHADPGECERCDALLAGARRKPPNTEDQQREWLEALICEEWESNGHLGAIILARSVEAYPCKGWVVVPLPEQP